MKRLVVPDGGRTGSFVITENGVRSILPFSPPILDLLRSAAAMVSAAASVSDDKTGRSLGRQASALANLAVQHLEQAVGPLDAEASLLYYDDNGGFSCGSTGKHPVPIPWPPKSLPTLQDLLASGVIEQDLIEYIEKGRQADVPLKDLFTRPAEIAKRIGVALSSKTLADLKQLDPNSPVTIKEPVDREILKFFHAVLADGRFLKTWFSQPYETAHKLDLELSDAAIERLLARGSLVSHGKGAGSPVADFGVSVITISVADAVIVYIVATKSRPIEEVVQDFSGRQKI